MLREKLTKSNRSLVLCENNSSITDQCSTVVPGKVILRASDQLLNSHWTPEYPILSTSWMHIEHLNSTFCPTPECPLNTWMSHSVQLLNAYWTPECSIRCNSWMHIENVNIAFCLTPGWSLNQCPIQLLNAPWLCQTANFWLFDTIMGGIQNFWIPPCQTVPNCGPLLELIAPF